MLDFHGFSRARFASRTRKVESVWLPWVAKVPQESFTTCQEGHPKKTKDLISYILHIVKIYVKINGKSSPPLFGSHGGHRASTLLPNPMPSAPPSVVGFMVQSFQWDIVGHILPELHKDSEDLQWLCSWQTCPSTYGSKVLEGRLETTPGQQL